MAQRFRFKKISLIWSARSNRLSCLCIPCPVPLICLMGEIHQSIPLFQCVVSSTGVEYPLFNIWFPARRDMETLNSPICELFFDSWHMSCWIWRNRNESLIPLEKVEYELNQRGVFDSKSSGRKGSSTPGRTPSFKYQLKASFPYSLVWVLYRRIDIEKKCLYFLSKPTYLGISGYQKFEAY